MVAIHVRNGVGYVSGQHTDAEIVSALSQADHIYVDYHQLKQNTLAAAQRIHDLAAQRFHNFGAVVVGMQGDAFAINGEASPIIQQGFSIVTEHFDDYERRIGTPDHVGRLERQPAGGSLKR